MEASDTTASGLTDEQKTKLEELDRLRSDGVISDEEFNTARSRVESDETQSVDEAFQQAQADVAAAQSPGEPQVVPEARPQAAVSPAPGNVSEASTRLDGGEPHGLDEIAAANSEENKQAAIEASRTPNLPEGQRVVIVGDHPESGRMAYVLSIHYTDGIQDMIARSGTVEARFADVDHYVLRTRDGRSDLLTATPSQVKALEENQGWGRGQI